MGRNLLKIIYFSFGFVLLVFISGCEKASVKEVRPSWELSSEERVWMKKFFEDFMLNESGIYTLWGSKPVTYIPVSYYTQEQIDELNGWPTPEEKSGSGWFFYDLDDNWINWKKISSRFPLKEYLLVEKQHPTESKIKEIYFVNILNAALIIQEYYAVFRQVVGFDFDPLSMVFEIEQDSSVFWDTVRNNSLLSGLLFGYGFNNAWCYQWKYWQEHSDIAKVYAEQLRSSFSEEAPFSHHTIKDFPIPSFVSFKTNVPDKKIEQYLQEREEIKKKYKGKDFLDLTLLKLTS